ncbi:MAG: dUTP diphosphatase [Clostridia bacterium]|nr:dUTP diphosphatase [Clostridia bacterium]
MKLKIKLESPKIGKSIPVPYYASGGAAGIDLAACIDSPVIIKPKEHAVIPTGISIALPSCEYVGLVYVRSSLGFKHGITLSNSVGVIDSDYRGEIKVSLVNLSDNDYTINPGDRIAQLVITPVCTPEIETTDNLPISDRGKNGFGSTGK